MDSSVLLFFEKMPQALPIYEAFTKRLLKELGPFRLRSRNHRLPFQTVTSLLLSGTLPDGSGAERVFIWL